MTVVYVSDRHPVCDTESVIITIREAVPQKYDMRTIDCSINYCVIFSYQLFVYYFIMTDSYPIDLHTPRTQQVLNIGKHAITS